MDINNLYTRYGAFNRVRVTKNQKIRFLTTLLTEFNEVGIQGKLYKTNYKQKMSIIGLIGDIHHSEYIYVTYYDTPVKNFIQSEYLPFNESQLKKRTKWNYLIPMFFSSVFFIIYILKILVPILQKGIQNIWELLAVLFSFPIMLFLAKVVKYGGIPSHDTLERNTSSVVTLVNFAKSLTRNQKSKVSFAFVDFGTTNYFGYHILKEILENSSCKVILLDNLSSKIIIEENKNSWLDRNFNNPLYIHGKAAGRKSDGNLVEGVEKTTNYLIKSLNQQPNKHN